MTEEENKTDDIELKLDELLNNLDKYAQKAVSIVKLQLRTDEEHIVIRDYPLATGEKYNYVFTEDGLFLVHNYLVSKSRVLPVSDNEQLKFYTSKKFYLTYSSKLKSTPMFKAIKENFNIEPGQEINVLFDIYADKESGITVYKFLHPGENLPKKITLTDTSEDILNSITYLNTI